MKTRIILTLLVAVTFLSCKDDKKPADQVIDGKENTTVAVKSTNSIVLSSYSDDNWKNGVGTTFKNMFLVDFSKENELLIKNGKEITLSDGKVVPYIGYEVVGNYIHILFDKSVLEYAPAAECPNTLTIK